MTERCFDRFRIGAYYLQPNARTEAHVRDLQACGIDLLLCVDPDRPLLDLLHRYGIGAVVSGVIPGWFGGDGSNAGTMRSVNPWENYQAGIDGFCDHPAILGIDTGDEPSSLDFPYYGEVIARLKKAFPQKLLYLNLYPSYGMLATNDPLQIERELGAPSYRDYLESYGRLVDLPYVSFDHYVCASDRERFWGDLHTVATYCRQTQKQLHVVLQVNSGESDRFVSEAELCYQAFCAICHGAMAISWACYSAGWWYNHVLDKEGNPTQQYGKLKRVNRRIRRLTAEYSGYQWVGAEAVCPQKSVQLGEFGGATASAEVLAGEFVQPNGKSALFLFFEGDDDAIGCQFSFQAEQCTRLRLIGSAGEDRLSIGADGICRVEIPPCDACWIIAE